MRHTAEAIVVGGGVIGASIAFHLARLGLRDVLLLERGRLAGQATGQSGALVRTHYTNAPEARLALAALPWFEQWADRVGGNCGFVQTGFLQIVGPQDRAALERNVAMLRDQVGVDTRLIDSTEATQLQPGLALLEGEQAAYEPRSGYANPVATTLALAAAAQQRGAQINEGIAVTGLRLNNGRITGVDTTIEPIDSPIVILANGGWAIPLVAPLGLALPIRPVLSQIAILHRAPALPDGIAGHLTIIDRARGYYARPHEIDLTLVGLSGFSHDLATFDDGLNAYNLEVPGRARAGIAGRIAGFAKARFAYGRSGPLDVTPDRGAIIGRGPAEGLFLAVGMSGSGFKKAPAIGACIAELILQGAATTAPIAPFRPERFAEGDLIQGDDYVPLPGLTIERTTER
jgi:sarcosine oxidase subunit beta